MNYFNYLPKAIYGKTAITDIITRATIDLSVKSEDELYVLYRLQIGDTPDIIAAKYYGDSNLYWLVLMANDMQSHKFEFGLDEIQFENYLIKKYGNSDYPRRTSNLDPFKHKLTIITIDTEEQELLDNEYSPTIDEYFISSETANTTVTGIVTTGKYTVETRLTDYTIYDYENELNESKKLIKLIKKKYIALAENELRRVYS